MLPGHVSGIAGRAMLMEEALATTAEVCHYMNVNL
jgi:hypothetical protein